MAKAGAREQVLTRQAFPKLAGKASNRSKPVPSHGYPMEWSESLHAAHLCAHGFA